MALRSDPTYTEMVAKSGENFIAASASDEIWRTSGGLGRAAPTMARCRAEGLGTGEPMLLPTSDGAVVASSRFAL